jgi:hypothetical protein
MSFFSGLLSVILLVLQWWGWCCWQGSPMVNVTIGFQNLTWE